MQRMRGAWLTVGLVASLWAAVGCSSAPEGTGNGEPTCTGSFCFEEERILEVTPKKLSYVDLAPGTTQELTLKLTNQANLAAKKNLDITAVQFDPATTEFQVVEFAPSSLEPGASTFWVVRYKAEKSGGRKLNLIIVNTSSDATKRNLVVPIEVVSGGTGLVLQPSPLDFGDVAANSKVEKNLSIINVGSLPLPILSVELSPTGSDEFEFVETPKLDAPIPGGGSLPIKLRYTPKNGDYDETMVLVEASGGKKTTAIIKGNEIAPHIKVLPPKLDYGAVQVGVPATLQLGVLNSGMAKLDVSLIEVSNLSTVKNIQVKLAGESGAAGAFEVTTKGSQKLDVTMTVEQVLPNGNTAVASLVIHSNDPGEPTVIVPIFAKTDAAKLQVTPDALVDFAIVGMGVTSKRTVELFNAGSAPLDVSKVELLADSNGEFTLVPAGFAPATASPTTATLDKSQYASFQVAFKATGAANQQATGKLRITSTDPDKPQWDLNLMATRAQGTTCNVQFQPNIVNFGLLPYGQSKLLQLTLKNIGTGYCAFDKVVLTDCPGSMFSSAPTCNMYGSKMFKAYAPSTKLFNLGPGESGKLQLEFVAPEDLGAFAGKPNEATPLYGLIVADFKDVASGTVKSYPPVDFTKPDLVAKATPNLQAKVGKAAVSVLPGQVDFGVVTVGCKSPTQSVQVFNTGSTEVWVTKVLFDGCGVEVEGPGWPAVPKAGLPIAQGNPQTFQVKYGPQNVGKDQCQMLVYTGMEGTCADQNNVVTTGSCNVSADCKAGEWCMGQLFTVPIQGQGTLDDEFTDVYTQGTGKLVDVLFVIDNSGSMAEEQDNLIQNFKDFIQIATLWQNDYHIGVVTCDMDGAGDSGKLREYGGNRVITPKLSSPTPTQTFTNMADLGTGGSGTEQGLAAAEAALTLPLAYDSGKTCKTDADCTKPAVCVKGADDGQLMCGGYNRTFLRKNAGLEVVVLSDEEDQSGSDLAYFVNFFYSIKGLANKGLFHLHAIVGPSGGCTSGSGDAVAGDRYLTVANDTGGKTASICDSNFAQALKDIGSVAFGLTQQFFLSRTPDPPTIQVKVNGAVCTKGANTWSYDAPSNSVTFNEKGSCMPVKGDKVEIYYKMLCFP